MIGKLCFHLSQNTPLGLFRSRLVNHPLEKRFCREKWSILRFVFGTLSLALLVTSGCVTSGKFSKGVDFQTRCQSPGVVRCFGFDTSEATDPYVFPPWGQKQKRGKVAQDHKASGKGSLRFEIPPNSHADTSGHFRANFSEDLSVQFGEGQEFYIQWRQRFSHEFLETHYAGAGGWKMLIVGEGDRPGHTANSCTQLEIVVDNSYHGGWPSIYHSCGGKDGRYDPVGRGGGFYPNEWMTFQLHVKIGTWYKNDRNYHRDSGIQLWVAREGRESDLVIDLNPDPAILFGLPIPGTGNGYDLANNNPHAKYGKVWLLPYNTGKDPTVTNPVAFTWYDELIISREKIPDPT